jgi:hypothetical protein
MIQTERQDVQQTAPDLMGIATRLLDQDGDGSIMDDLGGAWEGYWAAANESSDSGAAVIPTSPRRIGRDRDIITTERCECAGVLNPA